MPKPPTRPNIYDSALQIKLSSLKKWGFVQPGRVTSGGYSWSDSEGNQLGSVSLITNMQVKQKYIELKYSIDGKPVSYRIGLTSIPSNLGRGEIWYFVCLNTGKRCRVLYSFDGLFLHRESFRGAMYETQKKSKYMRNVDKVFGNYFDKDKLYSQLHQSNRKKTYAGKPTKRYTKILEKIEAANKITTDQIERLLVFGKW